MPLAALPHIKALTRRSLVKVSTSVNNFPILTYLILKKSYSGVHMDSGTTKEQTSSDENRKGVLISEITRKLESWAPLWLAGSWDKVGLQVEPSGQFNRVRRLLLTNDLTEAVVNEAIENGPFGMIVSYHPPIFQPLKTLTNRTWKERVITACIENKIAVYSPHTAWDAVENGVNDWLASAFVTTKVEPLTHSKNWSQSYVEGTKVTHSLEIVVPSNDEQLGCFIDFLTDCAKDIGTHIHDLKDASDCNKIIIFECDEDCVHRLLKLVKSWPLKPLNLHFRVTKYEQVPVPGFGEGRLCTLKESLTLKDIVDAVKSHLKLDHIRLAMARNTDLNSPVHTLALCAGSGSSVLAGVKADVLLTGEMGHHEVLEATHRGSHVILCEHSNTERGFLRFLVQNEVLHKLLDGCVEVVLSSQDKEPLQIM